MMREENKCQITKAKRNINRIIVHCSATKEGCSFRKADIDRWHNAKGWDGCGYHYVIGLDGKVEPGRNVDDKGAHAGAYNTGSIGICYIGGIDKQGKAKDTRTAEQKESLLWLLTEMHRLYPGAEILGHRDLSPDKNGDGAITPNEWLKACPSYDVRAEYQPVKLTDTNTGEGVRSFDRWRRERLGLPWWLIGLYTMVAVAVMLTGCSPKVTSDVREVRTDTVYVGHQTRDSIYLHDSLYIHEYARGETIYVDRTRWRELYVDRWKRDTVYQSRVDTCVVYREVIKEPTVWERWKNTAAKYGCLALMTAMAAALLRRWLRKREQ